jgi:hypothetical protein
MDAELREAMTFAEFCSFKGRNRPRFFNRGPTQNYELQAHGGQAHFTIIRWDVEVHCTSLGAEARHLLPVESHGGDRCH